MRQRAETHESNYSASTMQVFPSLTAEVLDYQRVAKKRNDK